MTLISSDQWTAPETGRVIGPRFVAMFDVLGFREMVKTRPLHIVLGEYEDLITAAQMSARMTEIRTNAAGRAIGLVRRRAPHAVFSDTLLFWSNDDEDCAWSFFKICGAIAAEALNRQMPLRGGIAFGEAILDKSTSTYLGRPIVDAYVTEASQEWVGVGIHESCFSTDSLAKFMSSHEDIVRYAVPTKPKAAPVSHALLWHQYMYGAHDILKSLRERAPTEAKAKYDNAIRFAQENALR